MRNATERHSINTARTATFCLAFTDSKMVTFFFFFLLFHAASTAVQLFSEFLPPPGDVFAKSAKTTVGN